jgi:phage host-nuclease inhibitor protein Gam
MSQTRRKTPALAVPQSIPEAVSLIERYVALEIGRIANSEAAEEAIARIRGECDRQNKPLEQESKQIFLQLTRWWAVVGDELAPKKRRSIKLAGVTIGTRLSSPKLSLGNHSADEMIAELLKGGWDELVRVKKSLDRQAIIKRLKGEHGPRLEELGLSVTQGDEFFIDRPGPKRPDVEVVAEEVR